MYVRTYAPYVRTYVRTYGVRPAARSRTRTYVRIPALQNVTSKMTPFSRSPKKNITHNEKHEVFFVSCPTREDIKLHRNISLLIFKWILNDEAKQNIINTIKNVSRDYVVHRRAR